MATTNDLPRAVEVVLFLCELAAEEEEPDQIDQLRAQKLLYFAQARSLVRRGRPLFADRIEAWPKGPVVPGAGRHIRKFGKTSLIPKRKARLSEEDKAIVVSMWLDYREFSNTGLIDLTHETGGPWDKAREGLAEDAPSNRAIDMAAMREFFAAKLPPPLTDDELANFC